MTTIGLLHPGAMGAAVGAQAVAAGATVTWLPAGRSAATRARAEAAGLRPATDLESCDLVISVCPPAFALDVAEQVAASGFTGGYLDANAISPARSQHIADLLDAHGITMADGGIVGPPPTRPGASRLYLSGPPGTTGQFQAIFAGTHLTPTVLPGDIGQASALKLAFAAYNKISHVLAAQSAALADGFGVRAELLELTAEALPGTPLGRPARLADAGARAWRWAPEMREVADACAAAGLPTDLPLAAADLFDSWSAHKDSETVTLDQLLADLSSRRPPASG